MFGRTRSRRRRAVAAARLADTALEPAFLYLTSTRRKRDQVLREFEGRDAFHPEVHVFADWWAAWWRRWGDGRVVASQRTLALAAWRLLDARPGMWPTIDAVPDRAEAAWALAALDQQLDAAEAPRPVVDPAVNQAIGALRAMITRTGRLIRRTDALRSTIDRLEADGIAGTPPQVIVDDLFGLTDLDGALLTALCRAWDRAGADVVLATASGRDRGGLEVPALLGVTGLDDPDPDGAGGLAAGIDRELRVFSATRTVRRAALELVSTGEAASGVATDRGWVEVEPWSEPWAPPPPDLADHYAAGTEIPAADAGEAAALAGPIRLMSPADRATEARLVARRVADALRDGADPRACVIAAPDVAAVGAALAHALADHGVAFSVHGGDPVAATPVGRGVRWLTGGALDGYGPEPMCGLADLLDWPMPVDPRAIRRFCAAADVRTGHPSTWDLAGWAARTRAVDPELLSASLASLGRLADALAPLAEDRTPDGWHHALHLVADAVGWPARCQVLGEAALSAWAAIADAAALLARDLALVDLGPWPAARLREAWDRALDATSAEPTDRGLARVPIVPLQELCGLAPAHVFVVGLSRGSTPRRRPAFLDPTQPTPPDRDPDAVARYVLASLLREALDPGGSVEQLVLSWPATERGARIAPAAVLAELLDLPTRAGPTFGRLLLDEAPAPLVSAIASRSEALAAAARAHAGAGGHSDALALALALAPADADRVRTQVLAVRDRDGPLGPRDGLLDPPPPAPSALPVTAVDTFLACPARYWYGHVLGLAPPDATRPELEPRRRGIAVHRILERFVRERPSGVSADADAEQARLRALLHAIASEVLDAVEAEGGFDPMFHGYARTRWLAGLADDRPSGMLRAWLDAEVARPDLVPESVELRFDGLEVGPVTIRGVIDRVDRLPGGARLVTDYKTGAPPTRARVEAGLAFQGLAYAAHIAKTTGAPVASAFLSLARPDAIRRTTFAGDPSALDAACTPTERRAALDLPPDARDALMDRAARALDRLVAGAFPPTPHGRALAGCPRCPFRRVCRLDELRHSAGADPDALPWTEGQDGADGTAT